MLVGYVIDLRVKGEGELYFRVRQNSDRSQPHRLFAPPCNMSSTRTDHLRHARLNQLCHSQVLWAPFAPLIKWKVMRTISLLRSVSVSQRSLVDNTILNINMHAVRLSLLSILGRMRTDGCARAAPDLTPGPLPTDTSKPEWKMDGTIVPIPELPLYRRYTTAPLREPM
jgi:hypothetical protein